jgi:hypothetical protein
VALVVLLVVVVVRLLVVAGVLAALAEGQLLPVMETAAGEVRMAVVVAPGHALAELVAVLVEAEPLAAVALFVSSTLSLA